MDRRGFLARMTAAAAAFTAAVSGVKASAGVSPAVSAPVLPLKATRPSIVVSANTAQFEKDIGAAGRQVVQLLRTCRVAESGWCVSVGDLRRYRVVFEQRGPSAPLTDLDHEAWMVIEKGRLTSVNVQAACDEIDVTSLDAGPTKVRRPSEIRHTVTAEFVVL